MLTTKTDDVIGWNQCRAEIFSRGPGPLWLGGPQNLNGGRLKNLCVIGTFFLYIYHLNPRIPTLMGALAKNSRSTSSTLVDWLFWAKRFGVGGVKARESLRDV